MNLKKITSLVVLWSFLVMSYTGVILFITPQGRVANWANWEFLGLNKEQYGEIHSSFMLIFVIAAILHIFYNFKPVLNYLSNEARKIVIFTKEMVVATMLSAFFLVGTIYQFAPFSTFLSLGQIAEDYWAKICGEPPYGHAELSSLKSFMKKAGLNEKSSLESLKKEGIVFEGTDEKLIDIAKKNNKSPNDIYEIMIEGEGEL